MNLTNNNKSPIQHFADAITSASDDKTIRKTINALNEWHPWGNQRRYVLRLARERRSQLVQPTTEQHAPSVLT